MNQNFRAIFACVFVALVGVGCNPLVVGPVQIALPAGEASLPLSILKQETPIGISIPYCDLPSEEGISQMIREVGGFDVSRFVRIRAIELQETRFEATSGDFSFANAARLDLELFNDETFELGTASAPQGFGPALVLRPTTTVDVLSIIRANDANTSAICPVLSAEFNLNALAVPATTFEITVVLDAFVELGLF